MIAKRRTADEILAELRARKPTPEQKAAADAARAIVARHIPPGTILSDELIADRRREAASE